MQSVCGDSVPSCKLTMTNFESDQWKTFPKCIFQMQIYIYVSIYTYSIYYICMIYKFINISNLQTHPNNQHLFLSNIFSQTGQTLSPLGRSNHWQWRSRSTWTRWTTAIPWRGIATCTCRRTRKHGEPDQGQEAGKSLAGRGYGLVPRLATSSKVQNQYQITHK